jgi:DNA topoisomerase-1
LQQEANNRLGYSSKQTMMLAQQLYEGVELGGHGHTGLITYMRTDSVNLAEKFVAEARAWIGEHHGAKALPEEVRKYKTRAKNAQEAHEAVRPADPARTPESVAAHLDPKQLKLYELIWSRAIACQMTDAELATIAVDIDVPGNDGAAYVFHATGSTITYPGFMAVYETDTKETKLPELLVGDALDVKTIDPKQHFTEPPPRYTEASLVKALEENGIGRPSTYAPTIATVVERGYVEKDQKKLVPTELATKVNDLLVEHFPNVVDYQFTAKMEEDLDEVADDGKPWQPVVAAFYEPFKKTLEIKEKEIVKTDEISDVICDKCGKHMVIKFGRFGKFLACSGYPECKSTKQLAKDGSVAPETKTDEKCPTCGADMIVKRSRFGEFLSCSRYPECKTNKPIVKKTGVKCNLCGQGEFVERKSRFGKFFYSCERYPECKNALWSKPTGENCTLCKHPIVLAKNDTTRCSNKECPASKQPKDEKEEDAP